MTNQPDGGNSLHLFLLTLAKFGLATPYDLMSQAGFAPGLTSNVLQRLEERGWLKGATGPRNRTRYELTEIGEEELRSAFDWGREYHWWIKPYSIFEEVPRAMILAWLSSGSDGALDCIGWAAEELRSVARKREREAEGARENLDRLKTPSPRAGSVDPAVLITTTYLWIKKMSEAQSLTMQAELLERIAPTLSDLPPAPKLFQREISAKKKPTRKRTATKE